ncbi:hypothetical protein ABT131_26325 [Streptomyces sp900105245]|uniref:hypothetical protein n=1 Tax=Streptomyces sp. 900105245 TaxID=3154379 RepID=UPI003317D640
MLALRLTRAARPAVQLRRLLVAAASAGTGFLLLSCLGYALDRPEAAGGGALRLAWCAVPLAATVYLALAVARTDPGTRPRPGLSAVGLGPARLMAISALTTALSCTVGSLLALLFFLHLRGDLRGLPFDGAAADFLAAGRPLPVPAALTLLALAPAAASATVALVFRPTDPRPAPRSALRLGGFGAHGRAAAKDTFGSYGRFGTGTRTRTAGTGPDAAEAHSEGGRATGAAQTPREHSRTSALVGADGTVSAPEATLPAPGAAADAEPAGQDTGPDAAEAAPSAVTVPAPVGKVPADLPWGIALLAAGLTVHAYAGRSGPAPSLTTLPGEAVTVLLGWLLTTVGFVLAAPGLTHLCGLLLQCARPGALRLLAGRFLMSEAGRIGRPLGVVCAVASAGYAMTLYSGSAPSFGPLTALGALLVAGCTVATLLTAAVEARQCRADTIAALLRLGAPATMLRGAAALRVAALLALFGPLTAMIAALAALPAAR